MTEHSAPYTPSICAVRYTRKFFGVGNRPVWVSKSAALANNAAFLKQMLQMGLVNQDCIARCERTIENLLAQLYETY